MSIVKVHYRDETGTYYVLRCPVCDYFVKDEFIVWERRPTIGDPGKIRHCTLCNGVWRSKGKHVRRP